MNEITNTHNMSEDKLKKNLMDRERELINIKNEFKNIEIKLQDLSSQNISLTEQLLIIKDENKKLRDESIEMHRDMNNLLKEETDMENQSEYYKHSAERAQQELQQVEDNKAQIVTLTQQLTQLHSENEKIKRDLNFTENRNSELQKMMDKGNLSSNDMQKEWSGSITKLTKELTETSTLYNQ